MKLNKKLTEQIGVISKQFEITKEEATEQFNEILTGEKLKEQPKKTRANFAMRILLAQLSSKKDKDSFGGKTEDVTIRVEMKEEPTEFKRNDGGKGYRSSIYCTAQLTDGDPFFTVLTLWGDANEINPEMIVGTTYTTKVVSSGNALTMNNAEILTQAEDKLPGMKDVITDAYKVVEIADAELNVSADYNDLKLIKGVVAGAWSKKTANDNMMGFLKIISEDGLDSMVAKFSRIYEQVDYYADGSLIYVLGQITGAVYDEDTGETKYDVSAWGNLVIPIEAIEKETENEDEDDDEGDGDFDDDFDVDDDDEDWDEDEDEDENEDDDGDEDEDWDE